MNRVLRYYEKGATREPIVMRPRAYAFRRYQRIMAWRFERGMRLGFWIGVGAASLFYMIIEFAK